MKKKLLFAGLILVLILAGFIFYPYFLNAMARFLIVQDRLSKTDVIVVLGGDSNGERVEEGVRLYHITPGALWELSKKHSGKNIRLWCFRSKGAVLTLTTGGKDMKTLSL